MFQRKRKIDLDIIGNLYLKKKNNNRNLQLPLFACQPTICLRLIFHVSKIIWFLPDNLYLQEENQCSSKLWFIPRKGSL